MSSPANLGVRPSDVLDSVSVYDMEDEIIRRLEKALFLGDNRQKDLATAFIGRFQERLRITAKDSVASMDSHCINHGEGYE